MTADVARPIVGLLSPVREKIAALLPEIVDAGYVIADLHTPEDAYRVVDGAALMPVILADAGDHWRKLAKTLASRPDAPNIIVVSRENRGELLADVLEHGGFDVIYTESGSSVRQQIETAHFRWQRRKQQSELSRDSSNIAAG